jgi:hypothetical protein
MAEHTWRESIEAEGEHLAKKIEQVIAEKRQIVNESGGDSLRPRPNGGRNKMFS